MTSPAQIYAQQPGVLELAPKQGVLKRILKEGFSEHELPKTPSLGDQVEVSYTLKVGSGLPNAGKDIDSGHLERYLVGSALVCRGLDVVVCSMMQGETATARLKHLYAGVNEAREITLTLKQIHPSQLLTEDGSVERWRVAPVRTLPPTGSSTPPPSSLVKDRSQVEVEVEPLDHLNEATVSQSHSPRKLITFTVGDGTVASGLEMGVMGLAAQEEIELQIQPEYCLPDEGTSSDMFDGKSVLRLRVKLLQVSPACSCSPEQLLQLAESRKSTGTELLRANRVRRAMEKYCSGTSLLLEQDRPSEDTTALQSHPSFVPLLTSLLLNTALAALKLNRYAQAESACNQALQVSPANVKAFFRRGSARIGLGKWDEACSDLLKAKEIDSGVGAEVRRELQRLKEAQATYQEQDSEKCKKMFNNANELYDASERAKCGSAFPCNKDLVAMDLQEVYREIEEDEELEEAKRQASEAIARGRKGGAHTMGPVNPWDRDGKKQEAELYDYTLAQMAEAGREDNQKHYESGVWMKNHPHHHAEWLQSQPKGTNNSAE